MREDLEQKLMDDFPWMVAHNIWTGEKLDFPIECECEDGWFDLIYQLCLDIQKVLDKESVEFIEEFYPVQIKEKYATLNFYISYGNDKIFDLIDEAEAKSRSICEECGSENAKTREQSPEWIFTRCDKCWSKMINR